MRTEEFKNCLQKVGMIIDSLLIRERATEKLDFKMRETLDNYTKAVLSTYKKRRL